MLIHLFKDNKVQKNILKNHRKEHDSSKLKDISNYNKCIWTNS